MTPGRLHKPGGVKWWRGMSHVSTDDGCNGEYPMPVLVCVTHRMNAELANVLGEGLRPQGLLVLGNQLGNARADVLAARHRRPHEREGPVRAPTLMHEISHKKMILCSALGCCLYFGS